MTMSDDIFSKNTMISVPEEVKELTPVSGTAEDLFRKVSEDERCEMSRSTDYKVEQDGSEIIVIERGGRSETELFRYELAEVIDYE